jgi:hypothetical protein
MADDKNQVTSPIVTWQPRSTLWNDAQKYLYYCARDDYKRSLDSRKPLEQAKLAECWGLSRSRTVVCAKRKGF